jgi:tRNA(adenine34) deaminase
MSKMMKFSTHYWETLIRLAEHAARCNEVPISAMLIHNDQIIAMAHNTVETHNDPTLHAEMLVLKEGFAQRGKHLSDCDLYVSLEPCPMCAHAIKLSQVRRLYFGAYDPKGGGVEHGPRILQNLDRIEIFGGFHEKEFNQQLQAFFATLRKN